MEMLSPLTGIPYHHSVKWSTEQLSKIASLTTRELSEPQKVLLETILQLQRERAHLVKQQFEIITGKSKARGDQLTQKNAPKVAVNYVLLKPVSDGCNLRCSYCYEGPTGIRQALTHMPIPTLERIINEVCSQGLPKVGFSFHGGEPLLAGLDFFKKAVEFQKPYREKGVLIENTVQTNGTLINREWVKFFKEHNFSIGTSFDGIRTIHDKYRIFANGKGSFHKVIQGIEELQRENVKFGVISVITNEHVGYAREHLHTFIKHNIHDFAVTPAFGVIKDIDVGTVSPKVFSDYVIDLFDEWLLSGNSSIKIRIVIDALKGFLGDQLTICSLAGTCTRIVAIEPNGNVKSCTRSCGDAEKIFGNILEKDLYDIITGDVYSRFRYNEFNGQAIANTCEWFEVCHNGCSANRVKDGKVDVSGIGRFCDCNAVPGTETGYAGIYRYIKNRTESILNLN